jgi:hypothetical protein
LGIARQQGVGCLHSISHAHGHSVAGCFHSIRWLGTKQVRQGISGNAASCVNRRYSDYGIGRHDKILSKKISWVVQLPKRRWAFQWLGLNPISKELSFV